ncbi:hypothetical protein AB5N19_01775 [Seiridium cardinale]
MEFEDHPVYQEQRSKLDNNFSGKTPQIAAQFHKFRKEVEPIDVKKVWQKDMITHNADNSVQIIGNWASFDVLQYLNAPQKAGMSMIHLLAIPATEKIANGVALTIDNVGWIDILIGTFKTAWTDPAIRQKILQHQVDAVERRAEKMQEEHDQFAKQAREVALAHCGELKAMIGDLNIDDFHYGLHLRPDASVDWLHLHILAAPYKFRKYSTSAHDRKSKDAHEVRDFIIGDAIEEAIKSARSLGPTELGTLSVSRRAALLSQMSGTPFEVEFQNIKESADPEAINQRLREALCSEYPPSIRKKRIPKKARSFRGFFSTFAEKGRQRTLQ